MRVAIWTTSSLEPDYEAVSKEIFSIAQYLKNAWIISVSPHLGFKVSLKHKYLGFNSKFHPLLRVIFPLFEYFFDINLVYGDISPWIYHKTLTKRPIIHCITQSNTDPQVDFLLRCHKIIVQTSSTQNQLISLAIPENKIQLWYPGVNLDLYSPNKNKNVGRVKILFATAPRTSEEMSGRGCYLLLDAAKMDEKITYHFLYRPWLSGYTSLITTQQAIYQSGIKNIELSNTNQPNMNKIYPQYDFTVIPYTVENGGKECPNSALESLACGVPVLVSSRCPLAGFINKYQCGIVFEPTPKALVNAIYRALEDYVNLSKNARTTAEKNLDFYAISNRYQKLLLNTLNNESYIQN